LVQDPGFFARVILEVTNIGYITINIDRFIWIAWYKISCPLVEVINVGCILLVL
jgi:hypothetical protein